MACTIDGCLKKRRCNGKFHCLDCFLIAIGITDTDMCHTLVLHNGLHIGKIQIDKCRQIDQICDSLYCLL